MKVSEANQLDLVKLGFTVIKEYDPDSLGYAGEPFTAPQEDGPLLPQTPFFKALFERIDRVDEQGNKDGKLTAGEITAAYKDKLLGEQLRKLIGYHPSEWQGKSDSAKWQKLRRLLAGEAHKTLLAHEQERIDKLSFWDEVPELKGKPLVYHFHPLAFVSCLNINRNYCTQKFHKISKIILKHEGGYVNDPNDSGGATNRGIAWKTWLAYARIDLGIEPTLVNLKALTEEQAEIIYRKRYWQPKGFCKIENDRIGLMIYDWTITSGRAVKRIQELLINEFKQSIKVDGSMGNDTVNAINNIEDHNKLLERITAIRKDYYRKLAINDDGTFTKNYKFLKGWLNRVDDCLSVKI